PAILHRHPSVDPQAQTAPVERVQRLLLVYRHLTRSPRHIEDPPILRMPRILEGPIADQLRPKPAIGREIDVLEEYPPEHGRDRMPGTIHTDRDPRRRQNADRRDHQPA